MEKFLNSIDRRYIYVVLLLVILFPLIRPIGLPVSINEWTEVFYREVSTLQPGDIVVYSIDYTPAGGPDVGPQAVTVFDHLMDIGVRVIGVSFLDTGPPQLQQILDPYMEPGSGKEYGVDFVNLGFIPGLEPAIAAFAADMKRAAPVDFFGAPSGSLPLMQLVNDANDVKMVFNWATGIPGPAEFVRQIGQSYNTDIMIGVVTVMGPQSEPYYQAGQIRGLLSGLRSAAEYEVRSGRPGRAAAGMDAQSLGHIVIIVAMVLGNMAYFLGRKGGAK